MFTKSRRIGDLIQRARILAIPAFFAASISGTIVTPLEEYRTNVVLPTSAPAPCDALYRETSKPEVYMIQQDKKIWIPSPNALFALGCDWSQVNVVSDGQLARYPRFNIPSSSITPGSIVFPPNGENHFPLHGLPNTVTFYSQGREVQHGELYGWLREVGSSCNDDPDFHYALELDSEWALRQGIDLNQVLRVGNIYKGIPVKGTPRRLVALPLVVVELNAWGWDGHYPPSPQPSEWTEHGNCILPFDPLRPNPTGPTITPSTPNISERGPYVRIAGSLITDSPHAGDEAAIPSWLSKWLAIQGVLRDQGEWWGDEWRGAVDDWSPKVPQNTPKHYARWTEIHPPDLIEVLPHKEPRDTVRALMLAARVGATPGPIIPSCEDQAFDLYPEATRPPNTVLRYEELRGSETYFPWGENSNNGSLINVFEDHINVKAKVCGGAIGGSPGRFKAIYRVWWEEKSGVSSKREGSFSTGDKDEIKYEIEPGVVQSGFVKFKLCQDPKLTWQKRINLPDSLGGSRNLIVKDGKRCDTSYLFAFQVSSGLSLTFYKLKSIVGETKVRQLSIDTLGEIPGGSSVTFTWMTD